MYLQTVQGKSLVLVMCKNSMNVVVIHSTLTLLCTIFSVGLYSLLHSLYKGEVRNKKGLDVITYTRFHLNKQIKLFVVP